ncbi:hypothetical protein HAX54_005708, partial [Datura stramonium]|nr:hypothetical protein [Datura stramonium]
NDSSLEHGGGGDFGSGWQIKMVMKVSEADCREERRIGKKACLPVLFGRNPSAECCERARVTHWECFCPIITPKLAAILNVKRLVRLIRACGLDGSPNSSVEAVLFSLLRSRPCNTI